MELEILSENELYNLYGGEKVWVLINGEWVLIELNDLDDAAYPLASSIR